MLQYAIFPTYLATEIEELKSRIVQKSNDLCDEWAKRMRLATLDSFGIENVSFLKIDVEGHELELLQGAVGTIERSRPIILIEVQKNNLSFVRSFLEQRGYAMTTLYDIIGIKGHEWNLIFMPSEASSRTT